MLNLISNIDQNITLFIYNVIKNPILDEIMAFITYLGDKGIIWICIVLALIISKKYRRVGIIAAIVLILSSIMGEVILKNVIRRPRPYIELQLDIFIKRLSSYSMPSGHTVSSFSVGWVVLKLIKEKRIAVPVFSLAILMALSRVYLCVHYLSDILAGVLLAFIVTQVVIFIAKKYSLLQYKEHNEI